ncbi:MAG: HlyD family secretion protein [Gammaproteobacteria bacterium]
MKLHLSRKKILTWGSLGLVIILLSYGVMHYFDRHPSTDDAYVQANTINVAAQVSGPVATIYVKDHETVKKGQLLFTLDPQPFDNAVNQIAATLAAQQAAFVLAEQNAARILRLVKSGQESKATGDQTQSQLDSARAELAADQAQLAQAKLNLEHTRVVAPSSGVVTQFLLRPGNNVVASSTLFMIVEQSDFWIDANFKETQVAYVKPGQSVKIVLDMFPKHTFHGVVDAVSSASGSVFSLLPPENASGNWVKVTQRFPVKIIIKNADSTYPLRAGATATATIDTTSKIST